MCVVVVVVVGCVCVGGWVGWGGGGGGGGGRVDCRAVCVLGVAGNNRLLPTRRVVVNPPPLWPLPLPLPQELRVFLETEGNLAGSFPWQQLQPLRGSLLEGIGRLPRQLIGAGWPVLLLPRRLLHSPVLSRAVPPCAPAAPARRRCARVLSLPHAYAPPSPSPPPPLPPGSDSSVPSTVEAQQNARNTSDLLRRFRELGERMRQEYKEPPVLGEQEARLRVRGRAVGWGGVGGWAGRPWPPPRCNH